MKTINIFSQTIFGSLVLLVLASCSGKVTSTAQSAVDTFPVMKPLVVDTSYQREYVAEINAQKMWSSAPASMVLWNACTWMKAKR
ncbi:MAG: hypothetical protein HC842_01535 [Cytophagales bacterium]|nr:hypothetical protein [Cytophagales bacterium]